MLTRGHFLWCAWSKAKDQCEISFPSGDDCMGTTQWVHGLCTQWSLPFWSGGERLRLCAYVPAHGCSLTLSVCSLQLKRSLPPFLLSLISRPLQSFLPRFLTLPRHFVGGTGLWAVGRCRGEVRRHATHCDAPPIGHSLDIRHVWEEAA